MSSHRRTPQAHHPRPVATHGAVTVLAVALIASCTLLVPTRIKAIIDNPRDYEGKTVTIRGEVTGSLNLLVVKAYTVRDGTGEITVVTERAVPRTGEKITVKGHVDQAFAIADKSLVVIVEEAPR